MARNYEWMFGRGWAAGLSGRYTGQVTRKYTDDAVNEMVRSAIDTAKKRIARRLRMQIDFIHMDERPAYVTACRRLVSQKRAYMGRERSRLSELGQVKTEAWRPAGKQRKEREARSVLSESTACCGQANEVQI